MALRKLAGPFEFKDLYGDYREAFIGSWFDELDGFLANGTWRLDPTDDLGGGTVGQGIIQLDGTFTPRVSRDGTAAIAGPNPPYDRVSRRISYFDAGYTAAPNPAGYFLTIYRGVDWFTLKAPYDPETVALTFTADGVHTINPFAHALLPDRAIFIGKVIDPEFYFGPQTPKIFAVPYSSAPFSAPIAEHTIQTALVPGSEDWESWDFGPFDTIIQSGTPERSVFLVRWRSNDIRALEYDYIQKKVVGWVRRLGVQPGLNPNVNTLKLAGYSVKHKLWAVEDSDPASGHHRMWLFADEAVPATLSNPVALSPTRAGEAVRYRVRLLGADYEPCIGHRVNWSCSALGTVLIPQSTTDADGYAETLVAYPPRFEGPWEGTNITAQVIF